MWVLTWWIGTCLCFFRIVDGYVLLGALGARIELWISQFLLSASPQWSASAITSLSSNFTKAGDLGALIVTPPGQDRRTYWAQHFSIWTSSRARSDLPGSAEQKNRCVLGEKKCAFAAKKSVEKQDFRSALEVHKTGRRQKMHQTGRSFQFFFRFQIHKTGRSFLHVHETGRSFAQLPVLRAYYQFCVPQIGQFFGRKLVNFFGAQGLFFRRTKPAEVCTCTKPAEVLHFLFWAVVFRRAAPGRVFHGPADESIPTSCKQAASEAFCRVCASTECGNMFAYRHCRC